MIYEKYLFIKNNMILQIRIYKKKIKMYTRNLNIITKYRYLYLYFYIEDTKQQSIVII